MTDADTPRLDPDQVACPTCGQLPGSICRQPNTKPARAIHVSRRRLAAGGRPLPEATPNRTPRPGKSNLTPEGRAAGGKASAQARARRKAELAARTEQLRVEAEARKIDEQAERLARDAAQYESDRAVLRRHVLDAAALANDRLVESLTHLRRPRAFDDDGNPVTVTVEVFNTVKGVKQRQRDEDGVPVTEEKLDLTGWYGVSTIESLAKAAASALNSLRLEEGKATGITGQAEPDASVLAGLPMEELVRLAEGKPPR